MKDTIYLIASKNKIDRMVKTPGSATDLRRGEVPIKINIEIPDDNWKKPFLEKSIVVNRWDKGIDVDDVEFEADFVTEEEAQMIREKRLEKMKAILESQGYIVERDELAERA